MNENHENCHLGCCLECPLPHVDTVNVVHIRRQHYGVCDTHGIRWSIGNNLISSWLYLTRDAFIDAAFRLAGYREIQRDGTVGPAPTVEQALAWAKDAIEYIDNGYDIDGAPLLAIPDRPEAE